MAFFRARQECLCLPILNIAILRRGKILIKISLLGLSESPDNWADDVKEESGPEYFDWEDYLHYPIPLQK